MIDDPVVVAPPMPAFRRGSRVQTVADAGVLPSATAPLAGVLFDMRALQGDQLVGCADEVGASSTLDGLSVTRPHPTSSLTCAPDPSFLRGDKPSSPVDRSEAVLGERSYRMSEIATPQRPQTGTATSIAPPMPSVAPTKTQIVAPKAVYQTWEISAVQAVPASSASSGGLSHSLDTVAESSPDKLRRKELENE